MKKNISLFFLFSAMCGFAFAQSPLAEFDKAKEIKILESNRDDVKKILAGYKHDDSANDDYKQYFSTKNAEVRITFSKGDCAISSAYWNVPEWVVTNIKLTAKKKFKAKDFDFSNFTKEIDDEELPEDYVFHDEESGIAFEIEDQEIQQIVFFPPKSKSGFLCRNENTVEVLSGEKRMANLLLEEPVCVLVNAFADVTELNLNAGEIILGSNNQTKNKRRVGDKTKISIATTAVDPENDVLTYNYTISDGKIIGTGANVVWDLSGVKAGTYTITAGVDDGCGVCGITVTKTVVVKECPDCQ